MTLQSGHPAAAASRHLPQLVRRHGLPIGTAVVAAVFAAIAVYDYGWISDDAFITLRYADNLLSGHGPVFNAGERVQGYTHPLWFMLLVPALAAIGDPVYTAVFLGVVFTLATIALLAWAVMKETSNPAVAALAIAATTLLFVSSEAWRSFQTGGLENPLANLLILAFVVEMLRKEGPRSLHSSLLISMLVLTRPDFAALVAPAAALLVFSGFTSKRMREVIAGLCPIAAWSVFAKLYYGDFLPNTANAKVGILGSWLASAEQGLVYVEDWAHFEPLQLGASIALLVLGMILSRRAASRAVGLGAILYLLYVILIGGDFMRGRFLLPFFVTASVFGVLVLTRTSARMRPARLRLSLALASLALPAIAIAYLSRPPINADLTTTGVINERMFYQGFHLSFYRQTGRLENVLSLKLADQLRDYAGKCGPVTVHINSPGAIGYFAGEKVSLIDTLGLTDKFVASQPNSMLIFSPPRVGHPYKYIPVSYLAGRNDIGILDGWREAVAKGDCDFLELPAQFISSNQLLGPFETIQATRRGVIATTESEPQPGSSSSESGTQANLSVTPNPARLNQIISLSGSGFPPSSVVTLAVNEQELLTIKAGASGTISASVPLLTPYVVPGRYVLIATAPGGYKARTPLTITP